MRSTLPGEALSSRASSIAWPTAIAPATVSQARRTIALIDVRAGHGRGEQDRVAPRRQRHRGQDRLRLGEARVGRGPTAARGGVIHAREIVEQDRGGVQVLDRDRDLGQRGVRGADHAADELDEERPQELPTGQRVARHVAKGRVEAERYRRARARSARSARPRTQRSPAPPASDRGSALPARGLGPPRPHRYRRSRSALQRGRLGRVRHRRRPPASSREGDGSPRTTARADAGTWSRPSRARRRRAGAARAARAGCRRARSGSSGARGGSSTTGNTKSQNRDGAISVLQRAGSAGSMS